MDGDGPLLTEARETFTLILDRVGRGDPGASAELMPVVYQELRRLAQWRMNQEQPGQTLQATALVHEAYIRLVKGNGEGTWEEYPPYNIDIDAVSAVDPIRDLLVTVDGRGQQEIVVHDLTDFNAEAVKVNLNGTSPVMQRAGPGFEWDPVAEMFVGWASGASVWTLTPPEDDWQNGTWEWNELPPADDNTVVPSDPNANNTYSRWRYMPTVNAYIVVNHVSEPVYIYKLSDGPGTGPGGDDGGSDGGSDGGDDGASTSGGDEENKERIGQLAQKTTHQNTYKCILTLLMFSSFFFLILMLRVILLISVEY